MLALAAWRILLPPRTSAPPPPPSEPLTTVTTDMVRHLLLCSGALFYVGALCLLLHSEPRHSTGTLSSRRSRAS